MPNATGHRMPRPIGRLRAARRRRPRRTRRAAPDRRDRRAACCATASACPASRSSSRSLGVALVTAREALRGHARQGARAHPARTRRRQLRDLRPRRRAAPARRRGCAGTRRIELRDLSLCTSSAIAGTAAEIAADRASDDDIESAARDRRRRRPRHRRAAPGARVGRFQLEVAAISQSPRLVREEVRLQSRGRAAALAVPARAGVP